MLQTEVFAARGKQVPRGLIPAPVFGNMVYGLSSEDPALHILLLLGKGKGSGGCYKLPFTPTPNRLDSYTVKTPRNKETSISRHCNKTIMF